MTYIMEIFRIRIVFMPNSKFPAKSTGDVASQASYCKRNHPKKNDIGKKKTGGIVVPVQY